MHPQRTCIRLMRQKTLRDRTQVCLYETRVGDCKDGKKENIKETDLTTSVIRFIEAPNIFILKCVVNMVLSKKKLQTNRDIKKSPARNIYSLRDRVWEPWNQIQCQMQ